MEAWESAQHVVAAVSTSPHRCLSVPPSLLHRVILGAPWSAMAPCRASCPGETSPAPSPTDLASTPTSVASPSGSRKLSSAIRDSFLDPAFWTPLVPLIPPQVPACAGTLTLLPDPSSFLKMLRLLISPAPPSTWSQDPLSPVERPVLLVRS